MSPILLVIKNMINRATIDKLADSGLEGSDKYVVDIQVKTSNIITVAIDGDTPVSIDDCIRLSRFIESNLDRDVEDYELRVTSFGADKPLKLNRQYKKNIGRNFKIVLDDDTQLTGKLEEADEEHIMIRTSGIKKKGGKPEEIKINFDDIKEAVIVLSFK